MMEKISSSSTTPVETQITVPWVFVMWWKTVLVFVSSDKMKDIEMCPLIVTIPVYTQQSVSLGARSDSNPSVTVIMKQLLVKGQEDDLANLTIRILPITTCLEFVPMQLLSSQGNTQFWTPLQTRVVLMHMLVWQKNVVPRQGAETQAQVLH